MSRRRNLSDQRGFGYSTCMSHLPRFTPARLEEIQSSEADDSHADQVHRPLLSGEDEETGDEDVGQRERDHELPAEVHQLVEAEARERRARPDVDRKSTRLNSSHVALSRMPSSA